MGIVDRIKLNARANLNHILDKAQDPQKMLDQFFLEMQGSVREVKQAVATAIVGVKKLEREISASSEKATQWETRTMLALEKDNEELARKALEQKHIYLEKERSCRVELEKQKQTVVELKESLSGLESKLNELHQRKIDLIKQYQYAQQKATTQISADKPIRSQIDLDTSAFDTYDRMVDKVRTMEAQAEALSELMKLDEVEEKFRKMESEEKIESELKTMKDKLQT